MNGLTASMNVLTALNPLGLAHVLPYLPLSQSTLDQQVDRRSDPRLWDELLADSQTKAIIVAGEFLAVPRGQGSQAHMAASRLRLAMFPLQYVSDLLCQYTTHLPEKVAPAMAYGKVNNIEVSKNDQCTGVGGIAPAGQSNSDIVGTTGRCAITPIFCGTDSHASYVALDITRMVSIEPQHAYDGGHAVVVTVKVIDSLCESNDDSITCSDAGSTTCDNTCNKSALRNQSRERKILRALTQRYDWVSLRAFAPRTSARDAGIATSAVAVAAWHKRQQYCPYDGSAVVAINGGWAQQCTREQYAGEQEVNTHTLFPRIEPAVIVAIVDTKQRILLQHNAAWRPGFYSVSAGFVEAGENLEHAARREVTEETGVHVGELKYLGSQPWPFPSSLMVAFIGVASSTDIHVDGHETVQARWCTREELLASVLSGQIVLPGKAAIARYMIEQWYGDELPDPA